MTKKKVMVNMLNQGEISAGWESKVYEWMLKKTDKYDFNLFFPTKRPIPSNRHQIVKEFLEGDWDYLVMLDDDNPCKENIFDLLDLDLPVVGGVYPGKTDRGLLFYAMKILKEDDGYVFRQYPIEFREGLKKVGAVATGLIVIQRWVIEKMVEEGLLPFEDIFDKDGVLRHSDDLGFCIKCYELGIDVYAHWDYIGSHHKLVDLLWVANLVAYAAKTGKTTFPDGDGSNKK